MDSELAKVKSAVDMGAEAIMDLSSYGDTRKFRTELTRTCPAIIGTVPIYDAVVYYHKPLIQITAEEWIDIVRMHAEDGVDFMTIHCGINKETAVKFKRNKRMMNIVSRGGSIIFAWMEMTGRENPFYEYFDDILEICRQYDVTLSLGDACRPGSIADGTDAAQIEELITLGELTKRAWAKDVQVMIEGPGHMPMNQIAANMEIQKTLCHGAPFYVLGPIVTDIAPGYDHITSAIGGAIAAQNGAAFLCYVTPVSYTHLPMPEHPPYASTLRRKSFRNFLRARIEVCPAFYFYPFWHLIFSRFIVCSFYCIASCDFWRICVLSVFHISV